MHNKIQAAWALGDGAAARSTHGETLSTRIAATLRAAIARCDVSPGSKIRLEELRDKLGVSYSPLREALSRLVAEGFVDAVDQRGFRVAPVSERNLREITQLRLTLEPMALRASIEHGGRDWESRVAAALHHLTANRLHSQGPVDEHASEFEQWDRAHRAFHESLLMGCKMPLLLQFCLELYDLNDRYRRLFLARQPSRDRFAGAEHRRIAEAALALDADLATRLLYGHIERVSNRVLQGLPEGLGGAGAANPASKSFP